MTLWIFNSPSLMNINAEKIRMPANKIYLTQIVQDVRNFLGRKRIDFMQDLQYIMLSAEMASTKNIEKFASKMHMIEYRYVTQIFCKLAAKIQQNKSVFDRLCRFLSSRLQDVSIRHKFAAVTINFCYHFADRLLTVGLLCVYSRFFVSNFFACLQLN